MASRLLAIPPDPPRPPSTPPCSAAATHGIAARRVPAGAADAVATEPAIDNVVSVAAEETARPAGSAGSAARRGISAITAAAHVAGPAVATEGLARARTAARPAVAVVAGPTFDGVATRTTIETTRPACPTGAIASGGIAAVPAVTNDSA